MTLRLHHGAMSRGIRIRWLLEEMELDYEIVPVESIEEHRSEEFLRKSPLGLLPLLEDGDTAVFESAAIMEYLLDRYGDRGLRPERDSEEGRRYAAWLHAAETVMQPLGEVVVHDPGQDRIEPPGGKKFPEIAEAWRPALERYLGALERELSGRDYIAGDSFTAADIMLSYFVAGAQMFEKLDAARYPNLAAYLGRLMARPAAAKALAP